MTSVGDEGTESIRFNCLAEEHSGDDLVGTAWAVVWLHC